MYELIDKLKGSVNQPVVPSSAEEHGRLVEGHKAVSIHGFRELKMETSNKTVITSHSFGKLLH